LKVFVTLGDGVVFGELSILNVPGSKVAFLLSSHREEKKERKTAADFDILVPPVRINLACTATAIPPFIYSFSGNSAASAPFPHLCVFERFIYSQDQSTYFLQQNRQTRPGITDT
jgi:hypothetical protein